MTRLVGRASLIVLMAAVTLLSVVPPAMRPVTAATHHVEHLLAFFATGVAMVLAFQWRWWTYMATLVLFALAIEAVQLFAPGRHARLSDLVVNVFGACLGVGLAHVAAWRLSQPAPRSGETAASDRAPR